jgi:molecular chaperone GrpE
MDNGKEPSKKEGPKVGESPAEEGPETATISVEELKQLRKKAEERDLYRNDLLRTMADFDNYQKRVRKDRLSWESQALDRFMVKLLPLLDDLERALSAAREDGAALDTLEEGVRLTHQELLKLLSDSDVLEIPAMGRPFDPHFHEAVVEEEVLDRPTGEIVGVVQKGYRRKDAVLRPSKVKVARNVAPEQDGEGSAGGKGTIGWPPSEELS